MTPGPLPGLVATPRPFLGDSDSVGAQSHWHLSVPPRPQLPEEMGCQLQVAAAGRGQTLLTVGLPSSPFPFVSKEGVGVHIDTVT